MAARQLQLSRIVAAAVVTFAWSGRAAAQAIVRSPGDHLAYSVELEPHLLFGFFGPPGEGSGVGIGGGFRASFEIVRNGFIPGINNSIAIGVGTDFLHYSGDGVPRPGVCTRQVPGPAGTSVCVEVSQPGGPSSYAYVPVVMQWNFWLTRRWSVFGEPGLSLYWYDYRKLSVTPALFFGGRWQFSDRVMLTMRVGYPTFTLGLSVLF
ncbi:MAG: hypothetical protein FWD17_07120 [Polyangiaceae bacterium]|nr:hypothetical protein [Polyangiaceae bacterium]